MQDASFHLAADDGAEDFRADGALSTSAPKVKPRLLADVLWDAANKYLRPDLGFSCCAVDEAACAIGIESGPRTKYDQFLKELGCGSGVMQEFEFGKKRQGVRYMWLLLAMHVAEDEGITV